MLVPGIRHSGHRRPLEALMSPALGPAPRSPESTPVLSQFPPRLLAALLSYEKQRLLEVVPEVKALATRLVSTHHHGPEVPLGRCSLDSGSGAEFQTVSSLVSLLTKCWWESPRKRMCLVSFRLFSKPRGAF